MLSAAVSATPHEGSAQTVEQLNQQARPLWAAGRYQQVLPLAQRALAINERSLGPEHPQTVRALNNLANVYLKTEAYTKAEPLYRRVLALRERAFGAEHPDVASALSSLAILYGANGDYARAEPLQQRALAIREKAFGAEHIETAKSLTNLAILYLGTGEYARAEPLYQRALAIDERELGPESSETAGALSNLATVYYYTGAYAQAEAMNLRALAIYERTLDPQHPDIAGVLSNLGEAYVAQRAYAQALPMYERALAIREQALGPEHPQSAGTLNNIAGLYRVTGEVARAEPLYKRALAINERRLGAHHPDTANSLNNLANLYLDTGAYTKAEPLYARALAIREQVLSARHPDVAQSLSNLALLHWARGQASPALVLLQRAQAIRAKNSEQFLLSGSESRQRAYLEAFAEDTFVNVSFSMTTANRAAIELGFSSVLQYKGRVLDTVADSVARLRRSISTQDRALLDELTRVATQASAALYQSTGVAALGRRERRLSELTRQQDTLEAQLAKRSSEFRRQTQPVTLASLRRALPTDAVLVEWIRYKPFNPAVQNVKAQWGAPRYAAYLVTARGAPAVVDLGEAAVLEELASNFNRAVSDPKRSDVRQLSAALSNKLIEPLLPLLRDHSRWLLAPDGALNLVPMAALLDQQAHYLAEHFEISYVSSGRDLLRIVNAEPPSSVPAVLVADPDYGAGPLRAASGSARARQSGLADSELLFKPLPGTALEVQSLQALLEPRDAEVLMHLDANEAQLRRLHGPRLLHIATHGFFLNDATQATPDAAASAAWNRNPLLRAGLALAGANVRHSGVSDDGILTALEMAQLDLRGTELVVLSACETASGDAASGEGIYGMRRALALAGAQAQITSLWQVSDQATRQLMLAFYGRLLQGTGRSAALRAAQRQLQADPARAHPYYWASFVAAGDWRPLRQWQ